MGIQEPQYLKVKLTNNYHKGNIALTLHEMTPYKKTVLSRYILPDSFTGPLSQLDEAEEQLLSLKEKLVNIIKENADYIIAYEDMPDGILPVFEEKKAAKQIKSSKLPPKPTRK